VKDRDSVSDKRTVRSEYQRSFLPPKYQPILGAKPDPDAHLNEFTPSTVPPRSSKLVYNQVVLDNAKTDRQNNAAQVRYAWAQDLLGVDDI
jgi:hypothetical protein